jgi:SAM-dependent methyltransferase
MKVHEDMLPDVQRYLNQNRKIKLEDNLPVFENILSNIQKIKKIEKKDHILEVGAGVGWFQILCKKKGYHNIFGIEISPHLINFARFLGSKYGFNINLKLGNIEDTNLGREIYDVVVSHSVFEHVEHWQNGIEKIYNALKKQGIFYFYSTNKFSLRSSMEYNFPMYHWLPDRIRYKIRQRFQERDIMKLGIDFNQFTYPGLRRFFKSAGFSEVYELLDLYDQATLKNPRWWKKLILSMCKNSMILRNIPYLFVRGTLFICKK